MYGNEKRAFPVYLKLYRNGVKVNENVDTKHVVRALLARVRRTPCAGDTFRIRASTLSSMRNGHFLDWKILIGIVGDCLRSVPSLSFSSLTIRKQIMELDDNVEIIYLFN